MRTDFYKWTLVLSLCVISPMISGAQDQARDPSVAAAPVFKAESDLVVLHVNVFDGRSDAVPDLPQSAFQIFEDGKMQPITFFSSADVPVAVGLVVDNSTSMLTRRVSSLRGRADFSSYRPSRRAPPAPRVRCSFSGVPEAGEASIWIGGR